MFGGERVVRNDDGQARAVDEALNDAPLAVNQREEVGTAVQEDEGATRAQALLREHAGHALVARRRETRSHRRRHGVLLRGTRRHVARGFLGVQRGRRKALSGVNETHLEGHGASFVSTNHSARTGTHPRANRYQDTLRKWFAPRCDASAAPPQVYERGVARAEVKGFCTSHGSSRRPVVSGSDASTSADIWMLVQVSHARIRFTGNSRVGLWIGNVVLDRK